MALNFTEVMLLAALLDIKKEDNSESNYGLCWAVNVHTQDQPCMTLFSQIITLWPKHSGEKFYPVPGVNMSAQLEYNNAKLVLKLWDKSTEYGMLRYELLDFCINYLQKKDQGYVLQTAH